MSLFDFPRIHFSGLCTLNPGTANNDDYSGQLVWPATGENLALIDSACVRPRTFGMSDADFRKWIQAPQDFVPGKAKDDADPATGPAASGQTVPIVPAEWNYYGDMKMNVAAPVTGVQVDPDGTQDPARAALEAFLGQNVSFEGNITDVNSEGSPPATQFFITAPTFGIGEQILGGTPGKGACQWINFGRNVNRVADSGAGGYIYHVIEGAQTGLPGFDGPGVTGVILRYYLFARHGGISNNDKLADLYKQKGINPAELQITGTIAPCYGTETLRTGPVGRLLTSDTPVIPVDAKYSNNLVKAGVTPTKIALAPAVLAVTGDRVSIDAIGTFPECFDDTATDPWSDPDTSNPKFKFGPVALRIVTPDGQGAVIGAPDYTKTAEGNAAGWIFEFDISGNDAAKTLLATPGARFVLDSDDHGRVLTETDYYVVTNAQAIYGEQNGSDSRFRNMGAELEPVSFEVFHRGEPVGADVPGLTACTYKTTPLLFTDAGPATAPCTPGSPLSLPVATPGTFLTTLRIEGEDAPPDNYNDYIAWPYTTLMNRTAISLRVLPNSDYSEFLDGPEDAPVGNDKLTFDVVYREVLRTYDLLFPAMNGHFDLGDEAAVTSQVSMILARTDPAIWSQPTYMPITRDLSDSRRTLLQAWCRKVMAGSAAGTSSAAAE